MEQREIKKNWKNFKIKKFNIKIELPKVYDGNFRWIHPDDVSREYFSITPIYVDNFFAQEMDVILIYRQLMLEAGFAPHDIWYAENKHYYKNAFGTWVFPNKTTPIYSNNQH